MQADRCVKIRHLSDESRRQNLSAELAPQPIWLATWRVGEIEGHGGGSRVGSRGVMRRQEGAGQGDRTKKESHRKGWPRGD